MEGRCNIPLEEPKRVVIIPYRTSSKRAWSLEDERNEINKELTRERKRLKSRASFDTEFWSQAAEIEKTALKRSEVQRKISLRDFTRNGESPAEWETTEEARNLFEQIRAQEAAAKICQDQANKLSGRKEKRSLRASFTKLFTTSKMGLNVLTPGAESVTPGSRQNSGPTSSRPTTASTPDPRKGFGAQLRVIKPIEE